MKPNFLRHPFPGRDLNPGLAAEAARATSSSISIHRRKKDALQRPGTVKQVLYR